MERKALMYRSIPIIGQGEQCKISAQADAIKKHCEENAIILADSKEINSYGFVNVSRSDCIDNDTVVNSETLQEMFQYLKQNPDINNIIVYSKSALWYNDDLRVYITRKLRELEVDVISVTEPTYTIYEDQCKNKLINNISDLLEAREREELERRRMQVWDSIKKDVIETMIEILDDNYDDYYGNITDKSQRLFKCDDSEYAKQKLHPIIFDVISKIIKYDEKRYNCIRFDFKTPKSILIRFQIALFDEIIEELIKKYDLCSTEGHKIINNVLINDLKEMLK